MVRVIVFALIALGWWLAAPDRFTAAARTATGQAARAAGSAARGQWVADRGGRQAVRTDRRDRWQRRGENTAGRRFRAWLWRRALGTERALVAAGRASLSGGRLARAAVSPVPGEVRDGWRKGQDRHRARTAGRPVPVALDPPWWRKSEPQDSSGQEAPPADDRTICPGTVDGTGPGQPAPAAEDYRDSGEDSPTNGSPVTAWRHIPFEYVDDEAQPARTPFFPDAPDGPSLDGEADIRARNPELARINPDPLTEGQRRFWHLRDRGYPGALDQDGWPAPDFHTGAIVNPMPYLHQPPGTGSVPSRGPDPERARISSAITSTSGDCDGCGRLIEGADSCPTLRGRLCLRCVQQTGTGPDSIVINRDGSIGPVAYQPPRTSPASTTPPIDTTGEPMPAPPELRTHVAVQDFAQQIARLSESSDFVVVAEKARTVGAQSRAGGFGAEMDLATDSLEETARRFAASVDSLREQAAAYGKTSLSVQGS